MCFYKAESDRGNVTSCMCKRLLFCVIMASVVYVDASLMCDSAVSDREKLALPDNIRCYSHKTIDQHYYRKSLIFHPDKKTRFSSTTAFNCLQEARRRLKAKQCHTAHDATHDTYSAMTVVQHMSLFLILWNCLTTIAITMRRGKDLTPYQQKQ